MPKTTNAASPSKGEAAVAETTGQAKTVDYRGVKLTLPPTLDDADGLLFDALAELEDGGSLSGIRNAVIAIIGDDQYRAVRDKHREDGVTFRGIADAMSALLSVVLDEYGVDVGNSSASEAS